MASFTAFLEVGGKKYPLQRYELGMRQEIDHLGRPASPVLGVAITCTLHSPVSSDSFLYQWMLSPTMQQDGKIRLLQAGAKATEKTISFFNAYCIDMNLNFFPGLSGGMGSSWLQLQISPQRVAVGAIVHDNNWPLDSHGAGETFSLAAYQANSVTAKAPKPPKPAICTQVADATDMRKSKKERYNARLAVIDATSTKLKDADLQPDRAVMAADATRVAGVKTGGKNTPSFSEALAANRRFELNNRAIERAKLTNAIYLMDKKKFYDSQSPPQPEKFKEMLAAQTWPTEKDGLPEGWVMTERSVPGEEPVYMVAESTFEPDSKPVLVFRGTDNAVNAKADWVTNIKQGNGLQTEQYSGSIKKAQEMLERYKRSGGFEIAGHSKAGGQAAAAGIITGVKTYTFNAAGVHPKTLLRAGAYTLDMAKVKGPDGRPVVDAFNFPHDILNNLQDTAMPALEGGLMVAPSLWAKAAGTALIMNNTMPTAAGIRLVLPAQDILGNRISSPWSPLRRVDYHGMPYLIDSMEKQKKDDLKTMSNYLGCQ